MMTARRRAAHCVTGALATLLLGATAGLGSGNPDLASEVNPLVGSANGGNTFPGAVLPFGMVQWSPETTRGDATRRPAAGGYQFGANRIRGFSLTHLSGTGCRGASGDVPFMPYVGALTSSPSADSKDEVYVSRFAHANEQASAGEYRVRLASGVSVALTATARTGYGRFAFPAGQPAAMLVRVSDSEVGSSAADVKVDPATRTVTGSVSSGNFCGYIHEVDRRSYYTLHFVAVFDQPFAGFGTWEDDRIEPGRAISSGGTTYDENGYPPPGKGSGAWVAFDTSRTQTVEVRIGISYVSVANARANLEAENSGGLSFEEIRQRARDAWNRELGRIELQGGTPSQRTTFYTALYHALLHPNLFSDTNGEYWGFDGAPHAVSGRQKAQYANFSGWDVYRSQIQLVALLDPSVASDIAQSLLNQAAQNGGVWDRWTHNSGATSVMAGDPSAVSVASIVAFGGTGFDVRAAYDSLVKAASVPTAHDLSSEGCPVECRGQRPSLDQWLKLHYVPTVSNSWGGAGETLEDAAADFSLAQLAERLGEADAHQEFLRRSGYWRNVFNPGATPAAGFIQNRNADGTWPRFDPAADDGFAEGSSAQYTWMIPFDARGLLDAMGGGARALERLDAFFHDPNGSWALTGSGELHAELDNEPSIGSPWLYLYAGRPDQAQATLREAVNTLWSDTPYGIPGNDDLGEMSSWYVFVTMGLYPGIPGRTELLLTGPLFPSVVIRRANGKTIAITAQNAGADAPYVKGLTVDGKAVTRSWLPESLVAEGGSLDFILSTKPDRSWATAPADAPPSFPPPRP
jgi:predicted alpha-1,2-mannosidase